MNMNRRHLLGAAAAAPLLAALPARAQGANTIRIGVLSDQSGPYRHVSGLGSAHAVRLAIQESGLAASGINVEVVQADHQNRSHAGSAVVRQWIDRDGIDVVVDVPGYSVALAVQSLVREKNKVLLNSGASTSELTGKSCSPNTVHWTYDDWMLARSTGAAMVRAGGESWFVVTADSGFGRSLERDITDSIRIAGGQVLSSVRTPSQGVTNFASFLRQARDSRAQVVALANPGVDMMNFIRQAAASGLTGGGRVKLAGLFAFITDVHALGLETAQGLVLSETFYWDLNGRTRSLTERLGAMPGGNKPSMVQAGCYAAVLHYLKAVADMGVAEAKSSGRDVVARMKAMPCDDDAFGRGRIRSDGRKLHPSYLFEVKSPAESRAPWDYYKLLGTTAAADSFRPLADGGCALPRG